MISNIQEKEKNEGHLKDERKKISLTIKGAGQEMTTLSDQA